MLTFHETLEKMAAAELPHSASREARRRRKEAILRERPEQVWQQVRRQVARALTEGKRV